MENETIQGSSILDKIERAQALSGFAALGVILPFRRRVGLRMTRGIFLWPLAALLALIGYYVPGRHALAWYAGALLLAGLWQHYNRWQELHKGKLTHTRSLGVSPFAAVPWHRLLPTRAADWITSGDRIHRYLDPLALFALGLLLMHADRLLALWLMFAAVSLRIFEEYLHHEGWNLLFNGLDAMLDGEAQKAFMDHVLHGSPQAVTDPATGRQLNPAAEELREQISRRMAEQDAYARAYAERQAQEAAARPDPVTPDPVTRVMNQVKETAEAVKEAAEAVSAVREATGAPERETIIIDRSHTSDTLVLVKETETAYVAVAAPPERDALDAEPEAIRLTGGTGTHYLPAPPDEQDKAA